MVHVFYIHSSITYLVALKVLEVEQLPASACRFLFVRGFMAPDCPVEYHTMPELSFPFLPAFWKTWQKFSLYDAFIDRVTGKQPFMLYCPHTDNDLVRLTTTHARCRGYSYIEEGAASYMEPEKLKKPADLKQSLLRYLYMRGRIPYLSFYEPPYKKAYCVNEHAFPGLDRKVVVGNPFRQLSSAVDFSGQHILVFDALVEVKLVSEQAFANMLRRFFAQLPQLGVQKLYFKYHPAQYKDEKHRQFYRSIMNDFTDHVEFAELEPQISLEELAGTFTDVTFYVVVSSVGMYAHFAGQKVYSLFEILEEEEPAFGGRREKLPGLFFRLVEMLR